MNFKKRFLIFLSFLPFLMVAQNGINNTSLDKAIDKISTNIVQKLSEINHDKLQQIIIMPIKEQNGKITQSSIILSNKIAHQTNLKLKNLNKSFNIRSFNELEDSLLNKTVNELIQMTDVNEEAFYRKINEAKKIDFFITGNYLLDAENNRLIIENVKILKNWKEKGSVELTSVQNVSVQNEKKHGFSPVWRSAIVPGWGQLYKKDKTKGYILTGSTGLLVLGTVIADNQHSSYYNLAIQNRDVRLRKSYLSSADTWENTRNGFMIALAGVYLYNLVDATIFKRDNEYACTSRKKINFYPACSENEFKVYLTYKF